MDSSALVLSFEGISESDVDLRPIEGSIAGIQLPREAQAIKGFSQILFGSIPHFDVAQELFGPARNYKKFAEVESLKISFREEIKK